MKGSSYMLFLIRFAFKNIWRYKRRTIITFIAISVGIVLFVFTDSMLKGFHYESVRNFIDYESSHIKIYNQEFYDEMSDEGFLLLDKGIENYKKVQDIISTEDISVTPRISFNARMINERIGGERPFTVIGIEPDMDKNVYSLKESIDSGRYLKTDEYGVIIGKMAAKKLEVKIGDMLTILTRTKYDTYQAISVEVVGIINPPNPQISRSVAYIPLDIAKRDLDMEGDITEIGIRAKDDDIEDLLDDISSELKSNNMGYLTAVSWRELGKDWLTLSRTKTAGSYIIILVIFIIAAVGVINTMLMSVFERIKEIGMMRALGMRDNEILWSFIFEGAAIGLFGAVFGVVIGLLVNAYQVYIGFDWSFMTNMDVDIGYRIMDVVKGVWNPESFIFAATFSILAPALISIYPSLKAIRMEITESLRTA
ncbi:FtsX-like permease family protein [Candidatus Poribacteria bacterium]|nr:FtsX-like permease family protein [Candidatus Poribacteria bacterium]